MHSIINSGLIDSRRETSQEGQTISVPHSREPDRRASLPKRCSIRPEQSSNCSVQKTVGHQDTVHRCNVKLTQKRRLQFYQTRSHAVALFNTLPAVCIEKAAYMKTGEELYSKVFQSQRVPRTVLTPNLHYQGGHDLHQPKARPSADLQSKQSEMCEDTRGTKCGETRSNTVDYRIQCIPHSAVLKEDTDRREIVKKLIQKFENHPNRDSLIEDLNEIFNPFSEKSKELITSMGNTEYFELCEISSKIQCPDCSLCWKVGIVYCTCGKFMQPSERNRQTNKDRYDSLSISGYAIKKNPSHGARHGPSMRQHVYHKAHDMQRKVKKKKCRTIKEIWYTDE